MRLARRSIIVSALVLASGCASIVGFEDLDFSGSPLADGGAEGSATDAPSDTGSTSDVSAPVDAGRDRATPIGCAAGMHDFCEDFEQPIVFADAGWGEQFQQPPGTITRTNGELVAEMIDDDASAPGLVGIRLTRPYEKTASGARKNVSIAWRAFVEKCPEFSTQVKVNVASADVRFYIEVQLRRLDGVCRSKIVGIYFPLDGGYRFVDQLSVLAAEGEWHDFAFALAQDQTGRVTSSLSIDDGAPSAIVFDTESDRDTFGAFFGFAPSYRQGGKLRFDDIRIDYSK